ncbi:MAG: hypothetical protein IJR35_08205 [Synergistaceae bacterium]|nr:hypothetical protein [Synergistaceae bacterium]MBQ9595824.1 hypothetical protein [Synergistaceae bacterium]
MIRMRKFFAALLVLVSVVLCSCAYADNMTFDNVTFNKDYKIKGYASVRLLGFKFVDMYAQWFDGKANGKVSVWGNNIVFNSKKFHDSHHDCEFILSGQESEFAWLKADVMNLQKVGVNFMKEISIKVIYDDEYEFTGWVRQFNYDYSKSEVYTKIKDAGVIGWPVCLSPADEMTISPMYKGHYAFGCTLPNHVVEDKESPLRMIINIGGNELTYNIR